MLQGEEDVEQYFSSWVCDFWQIDAEREGRWTITHIRRLPPGNVVTFTNLKAKFRHVRNKD